LAHSNPYSIILLQALSDWQRGGVHNKTTRGVILKKIATSLPPQLTTTRLCCFRRIDLSATKLGVFCDQLKLTETISSWTFDLTVITRLWGGEPEPGYEALVFALFPHPSSVILNIAALYRDSAFREACDRHRADIWDFDLGIGWYGDSQQEVILEVGRLDAQSVFAIGGYSNRLRPLAARFLGCDEARLHDVASMLSDSDSKITWLAFDSMRRMMPPLLPTSA
jgi:hypothetical protein